MRDHLIENRPKLLKEEDQWMLDRWTGTDQHVVKHCTREFVIPATMHREGQTRTQHRMICSCGWRSAAEEKPSPASPSVNAHIIFIGFDGCPVARALTEREQQRRKDTERVEWTPVE